MAEARPSSAKSKKRPVHKLRNREAFESFIREKSNVVIVAYHYMCPSCESYLKQFKHHASENPGDTSVSFAKIHIQLEWMMIQAELKGFVEEENIFLKKLGVGEKVPATLFYHNGKLKWKLEGIIPEPIFSALVKKMLDDSEDNK